MGSAMTAPDKVCEDCARECVRLANLSTDPIIRDNLMQMAREWMALAVHERKSPEPKSAQC